MHFIDSGFQNINAFEGENGPVTKFWLVVYFRHDFICIIVGNPNRKKMHIFGFVGILSTFVRPLLT